MNSSYNNFETLKSIANSFNNFVSSHVSIDVFYFINISIIICEFLDEIRKKIMKYEIYNQ